MTCTCPILHLNVGLHADGFARNWSPDCPQHGTSSDWWNSEEQRAKRRRQNERLRELQELAAQKRKEARGE